MIDLIELCHHISTKKISRSPRGQAPALDVLRVRPHEVAHGTVMRHFLFAIYHTNLRGAKGGDFIDQEEELHLQRD